MLTEKQALAVNEFNKDILLLARAGTGKTYTVAQKIAEAERRGYTEDEILCLTFTVKAADELRSDVAKYCKNFRPDVFTIHGFCYRLMLEYGRETGRFSEKQIADEVDAGELIRETLGFFIAKGDYKTADGVPPLLNKQLVSIVSAIKHERFRLGYSFFSNAGYAEAIKRLLGSDKAFSDYFVVKKGAAKYSDESFKDFLKGRGEEFMLRYRSALDASSLVDFDDLIFLSREITADNNFKKPAYKLIIVDEMQDTSIAEYEVIKSFFGKNQIMMCGDVYQTIYGWRGSKPFEIIKDFKTSRNVLEITLDGNKRSSKLLTYASSYFLNEAFGANIPLLNDDIEGEEKIDVVACEGIDGEAREIFERIKSYDGDKSDICVMARSNRYIGELYAEFQAINAETPDDEKISFFTADKHFQFYKKPVVKDALSFLRLIVNPDDQPSMIRLAKKQVKSVTVPVLNALNDYSSAGVSIGQFLSEYTYNYGDYFAPLLRAYKSGKVVVYDLETTGLDVEKDEAIQISAMKVGENGESEEFNRFIIPNTEISATALSVHGYDLSYVKSHGGERAKVVLNDFANFADGCVLVGHNSSSFDDLMLKRQLIENGVNGNFVYGYDTLKIIRLFNPQTPDYKLSTLCDKFGIVNKRAHDAFSDVSATKGILEILIRKFLKATESTRISVTEKYAPMFKDLYDEIRVMKSLAINFDYLSLFREIGNSLSDGREKLSTDDKESINDIYRTLKNYSGKSEPISSLKAFLDDVSLSGSQMDVICKKFKKVPLITVHQSKGCEFKEVILAGVGENEFPSYGAVSSGNETEEKRVFYVALTRAKEKLAITFQAYKNYSGNLYIRKPSEYISFLPADCVNFIRRR